MELRVLKKLIEYLPDDMFFEFAYHVKTETLDLELEFSDCDNKLTIQGLPVIERGK